MNLPSDSKMSSSPLGKSSGNAATEHRNDSAETSSLEGVVEKIVYENIDNGFFVGRLNSGNTLPVTFVGNLIAVSPGETVRLHGRWVDDTKFGRQFRVDSTEIIQLTSLSGIEKYLGSGLIDGIGPVYAKRLVEAFGLDTLKVIGESPSRLREVPGIGKKRVVQIERAWKKQNSIRSVMLFLQSHNIPQGLSLRIYKQYGDSAAAVLRSNPYRLSSDLTGVGFLTADKIARQMGIAPDSPFRIQAGLLFVLREYSEKGHVFSPLDALRKNASELLKIPEEQLSTSISGMIQSRHIIAEKQACYLPDMYGAEKGCADRLKHLAKSPIDHISINSDKALEWIKKRLSIDLSEDQRDAVRMGILSKVMVITGGPGTGKTTVIRSLLEILKAKGISSLLAAPTGRAAKRMESATGYEACTLHRLLEFSPASGTFVRNHSNPIKTDLLIVDEASMLDIHLAFSLFDALHSRTRLILVGDVDQLPSVGPGSVLMDIILSGIAPVVRLKKIFRQSEESGIIANAHRINRGELPLFNEHDFFMIDRPHPAEALTTIVDIVSRRLPAKFGLHPIRDIQIMAPIRRGEAGVDTINAALRNALNPSAIGKSDNAFAPGDKVMQTHNNYELDVYNGDVGVITYLDEETEEMEVSFEDERRVIYPLDQTYQLTCAYCTTVHKSQGSEYPAVVLSFMPQHYMMLQRNVLYTAITRGKEKVIIVGSKKAVSMAVHNCTIAQRCSLLCNRLRNMV